MDMFAHKREKRAAKALSTALTPSYLGLVQSLGSRRFGFSAKLFATTISSASLRQLTPRKWSRNRLMPNSFRSPASSILNRKILTPKSKPYILNPKP